MSHNGLITLTLIFIMAIGRQRDRGFLVDIGLTFDMALLKLLSIMFNLLNKYKPTSG